jgi:hypothetical protein
LFLYLGWRRFTRMEVKAGGNRPGAPDSPAGLWGGAWSAVLGSRPTGRVGNLARKELRLQKPVYQLAAVYTVCWLGTAALQMLRPNHDITYLFDVLTWLYMAVVSLLSGCVSLGEEKALGLAAAQLALPFSPRLQWLIKLTVCLASAALLSLALPFLLFIATRGLLHLNPGSWGQPDAKVALACVSGVIFLLGFWAISLTANTVRAALLAICGVFALPALAVLGVHLGTLLGGVPFGPRNDIIPFALETTTAAAVLLVLLQSLAQFQRPEARGSRVVFCSFVVAGVVLGVSFAATYFG